eukprot:12894575-Prorocentrum_lima.AAC.1
MATVLVALDIFLGGAHDDLGAGGDSWHPVGPSDLRLDTSVISQTFVRSSRWALWLASKKS